MPAYKSRADLPTGTYLAPALDLSIGDVIVGWLADPLGPLDDFEGPVTAVSEVGPGDLVTVTIETWSEDVPAGLAFAIADPEPH